jgi:hypothetical protein
MPTERPDFCSPMLRTKFSAGIMSDVAFRLSRLGRRDGGPVGPQTGPRSFEASKGLPMRQTRAAGAD